MYVKVKNWEHYNRALGKYIKSERHYWQEMEKSGCIPFDEAEKIANKANYEREKKASEINPKVLDILRSLNVTADRHGNIDLGSRAIEALKELGMKFDRVDLNHRNRIKLSGGWN